MSRVLRITDANTRKISNAVFDNWTSGVPDSWTATGSPTTVQTISEGTIQTFASAYALDITNGSTQAIRGYYQDVTDVNEGQTYYVSVYVKPTTGNVRLYAWDGGGTSNAEFVESSGTEWQQLIVEKTAASGGIRIGLIAYGGGSQAVFDLVQLATFNIEFIEGVYSSFFRVTNWEIQVPDYKGSGVFSSSPVAEGRKLIDGYWDNVTQTITFHLRGDGDTDITTQNAAAEKLSELFNALQAARDFSKTSWVRDPVYMQYKADNETNYRYAFIANARIPQLADQYNIEFAQLVMLDLDLIIEHPVAFGMPPGEGAPVLSGIQLSYDGQDYGNYDENGDELNTAEFVYVTNKHNVSNITNMHLGTGGSNLIGGSLPRVIANSSAATYFGIDSSLSGAGPFNNLVFYVERAGVGTSGTWQYYDWGSTSWENLSLVYDTTVGFSVTGYGSIAFTVPNDWGLVSPGGSLPTGWWIRYNVTGSWSTTPRIGYELYTANRNYVEIKAGALGHIAGLAHIDAVNISNAVSGSIFRVIGGLRSLSRGEDFQSAINLGNKQNGAITVTYSGMSSVQYDGVADTNTEGSTGWVAELPTNTTGYLEISIPSSLALNYIGEFRCFVWLNDHNSISASAKLSYRQTSTMAYEENETVAPVGSSGGELLDLGSVYFYGNDGGLSPDEIVLRIDFDAGGNFGELSASTLYLIPADEYQFDSRISDQTTLYAGAWLYNGDRAVFGTAKFPRSFGRALGKVIDDTFELSAATERTQLLTVSNGPMIVQSGGAQRFYFILAGNGAPVNNPPRYRSYMGLVAKMRVHYNPRYLGMRGSQ